jgi:hypothetical protein
VPIDWHSLVADEIKVLGRTPGFLTVSRVSHDGVTETDDQVRRAEGQSGGEDRFPVRTDLIIDYGLEDAA